MRNTLEINSLYNSIIKHKACQNDFFNNFNTNGVNNQIVYDFIPEYYAFSSTFPQILVSLINRIEDKFTRFFLVQILYSELGSGDMSKIHSYLFYNLGIKLGLTDKEMTSSPKIKETYE